MFSNHRDHSRCSRCSFIDVRERSRCSYPNSLEQPGTLQMFSNIEGHPTSWVLQGHPSEGSRAATCSQSERLGRMTTVPNYCTFKKGLFNSLFTLHSSPLPPWFGLAACVFRLFTGCFTSLLLLRCQRCCSTSTVSVHGIMVCKATA